MTDNPDARCKDDEDAASVLHDYVCVSGFMHDTSVAHHRFGHAAFLARTVYNAAVDRHVAFEAGVAYAFALSNARHHNLPLPEKLECSDRFLHVPKPQDLYKSLTKLRQEHPQLALFPSTMLRQAVDEACRAVEKHVKACVQAKRNGVAMPHLHRRKAVGMDLSITTSSFTLRRVGDGHAAPLPKARKVTKATCKNRRKRENKKARREQEWAAEKRTAGRSEARIQSGLHERTARAQVQRDNARERDAARKLKDKEAAKDGLVSARTYSRSDSSAALWGEDRAELLVQGMGRIRLRLTRPIPRDGVVKLVTLLRATSPSSPLQVRLTIALPRRPAPDTSAQRMALHEAVKHLPPDAPPLAYVQAVRAAGMPVRGDDCGVTNPSCDDHGMVTPTMKRPRQEVASANALKRRISWKDRCFTANAASALSKRERKQAEDTLKKQVVTGAKSKKFRQPKRSKRCEKLLLELRGIDDVWKNRNFTRACQDAAHIVRADVMGMGKPVLVATDPARMVKPLLAKGGPTERRKKQGDTIATPVASSAASAASAAAPLRPASRLSPRQARSLRHNLHSTRMGLKIRRIGILCAREGVVHEQPAHEGSTQRCAACNGWVPKTMRERMHECGHCGFTVRRDHNSALDRLGNGIRPYVAGPDPGGRVAAGEKARLERDAKVLSARKRRSGRGKPHENVQQGVFDPVLVREGDEANACPAPSQSGKSGEVANQQFQTETLPMKRKVMGVI